jgi:hypothetical protein
MSRTFLIVASLAIAGAVTAANPVATAARDKLDSQPAGRFLYPEVGKPGGPPPQQVLDRVKQFHPALDLRYLGSASTHSDDYVWSEYHYETVGSENRWPYGNVHVLWRQNSVEPVWSLDWVGDYQPHSRSWIDFDGDGQKDLFFFAGFEDVFSTHIYLWRVKTNRFSPNSLVKVYSNHNDYSVLLDMDRDGRPEILDSGHAGDAHIEHRCGDDEWDVPEIPATVQEALAIEYRALSRSFDQYNFTYNMPGSYPAWGMKILDPISILRIEKAGLVDVTERFPDHLQWRLRMLSEIRRVNDGKCLDLVDSVISHVSGRLAKARRSQALHPDALTRADERRRQVPVDTKDLNRNLSAG